MRETGGGKDKRYRMGETCRGKKREEQTVQKERKRKTFLKRDDVRLYNVGDEIDGDERYTGGGEGVGALRPRFPCSGVWSPPLSAYWTIKKF